MLPFFYSYVLLLLCLPSDHVQHERQRWSLISIPARRKPRKYISSYTFAWCFEFFDSAFLIYTYMSFYIVYNEACLCPDFLSFNQNINCSSSCCRHQTFREMSLSCKARHESKSDAYQGIISLLFPVAPTTNLVGDIILAPAVDRCKNIKF